MDGCAEFAPQDKKILGTALIKSPNVKRNCVFIVFDVYCVQPVSLKRSLSMQRPKGADA